MSGGLSPGSTVVRVPPGADAVLAVPAAGAGVHHLAGGGDPHHLPSRLHHHHQILGHGRQEPLPGGETGALFPSLPRGEEWHPHLGQARPHTSPTALHLSHHQGLPGAAPPSRCIAGSWGCSAPEGLGLASAPPILPPPVASQGFTWGLRSPPWTVVAHSCAMAATTQLRQGNLGAVSRGPSPQTLLPQGPRASLGCGFAGKRLLALLRPVWQVQPIPHKALIEQRPAGSALDLPWGCPPRPTHPKTGGQLACPRSTDLGTLGTWGGQHPQPCPSCPTGAWFCPMSLPYVSYSCWPGVHVPAP